MFAVYASLLIHRLVLIPSMGSLDAQSRPRSVLSWSCSCILDLGLGILVSVLVSKQNNLGLSVEQDQDFFLVQEEFFPEDFYVSSI